jgi:hypothetical protein
MAGPEAMVYWDVQGTDRDRRCGARSVPQYKIEQRTVLAKMAW